MYDPLREFREMQKALRTLDTLREFREVQKAFHVSEPLRELRKLREMQKAFHVSDPLREFREMQKAFHVSDSLREFREMQKALQVSDPLREFRKMQKAFHVSDPLRELREMGKAVQWSDPHRELRELRSTFHNSLADIRRLAEAVSVSDPLKHTRELLNAFTSSTRLYHSLYSSHLSSASLVAAIEDIESTSGLNLVEVAKSNIADPVFEILIAVRKRIREGVVDRLSLEFYLSVVITLLLTLFQMQLSDQSERRITSEIKDTREQVLKEFERHLTTHPTLDSYYIVERAVHLRTAPRANAPVVEVLYRNQFTRLVERKGKWIRVEYYDHLSGVHRSGWCYKKYLKRMPS